MRTARRGFSAGLASGMFLALVATPVGAQNAGGDMFQQNCAVCHTVGQGRLIGPDLAGVTERREEDWLIPFVQSSQEMIAAGDPVAVKLFEEFNQIPMPDQSYSADQIREILNYIRTQSGGERAAAPVPESVVTLPKEVVPADSAEAVRRGRDLFVGRVRFANGGPSCNACHTVDVASVTTGGALARDLTAAYSRLSENGLQAIIANSPFPVMATAMGAAPTDEETADLIAFLRAAEIEAASQPGRNYARLLLLAGVGGLFALLLLTGGAWYGRARRKVNHDIYERQISST